MPESDGFDYVSGAFSNYGSDLEERGKTSVVHHCGNNRRTASDVNRLSIKCRNPSSFNVRITRPLACTTLRMPGYVYVYSYPLPNLRSITVRYVSLIGSVGGKPNVAMNAPISCVPGKSTPSANAPPNTAKPTPSPPSTNDAKTALARVEMRAQFARSHRLVEWIFLL